MIQIKTRGEVEQMRAAGLVVARALQRMQAAVEPGISTADLDAIAAESIRGEGLCRPSSGITASPPRSARR